MADTENYLLPPQSSLRLGVINYNPVASVHSQASIPALVRETGGVMREKVGLCDCYCVLGNERISVVAVVRETGVVGIRSQE